MVSVSPLLSLSAPEASRCRFVPHPLQSTAGVSSFPVNRASGNLNRCLQPLHRRLCSSVFSEEPVSSGFKRSPADPEDLQAGLSGYAISSSVVESGDCSDVYHPRRPQPDQRAIAVFISSFIAYILPISPIAPNLPADLSLALCRETIRL